MEEKRCGEVVAASSAFLSSSAQEQEMGRMLQAVVAGHSSLLATGTQHAQSEAAHK